MKWSLWATYWWWQGVAWAGSPLYRSQSTLSGWLSSSSSISDQMASLTPPIPPPSWTHTPEEVLKITKDVIAKDRELMDKIAALPASECNFATVRNHVSRHFKRT